MNCCDIESNIHALYSYLSTEVSIAFFIHLYNAVSTHNSII